MQKAGTGKEPTRDSESTGHRPEGPAKTRPWEQPVSARVWFPLAVSSLVDRGLWRDGPTVGLLGRWSSLAWRGPRSCLRINHRLSHVTLLILDHVLATKLLSVVQPKRVDPTS